MLTLTQMEQYVRAETGELDANKVDSEQIKRYVNFEQLHIQNELAMIGFKSFTKSAVYTGATFTEPSDLMQYPNSIINLLASAGTRASITISYTTPTGSLIHTFKEPGTGGNSINIVADAGTYGSPATGTIQCVLVGDNFYFDFASGVLTGAQIVALFNADPVYSQYFTCSTNHNSAVIVPSSGTNATLSGGTGANYSPATEVSLQDFVRIEANAFKAPSATSPKYRRIGNANGKLIEVLPSTVTYTQLEYYYRLADLSATTDTLKVPAEVEELVLLGVMMRIYEKVGKVNEKQSIAGEYEMKWKKYVEGYVGKRESETTEKNRLQSSDVEN